MVVEEGLEQVGLSFEGDNSNLVIEGHPPLKVQCGQSQLLHLFGVDLRPPHLSLFHPQPRCQHLVLERSIRPKGA